MDEVEKNKTEIFDSEKRKKFPEIDRFLRNTPSIENNSRVFIGQGDSHRIVVNRRRNPEFLELCLYLGSRCYSIDRTDETDLEDCLKNTFALNPYRQVLRIQYRVTAHEAVDNGWIFKGKKVSRNIEDTEAVFETLDDAEWFVKGIGMKKSAEAGGKTIQVDISDFLIQKYAV
jgi:hypothetical protein